MLILSALLCLCMLFASCQSGEIEETEPEETVPQETNEETGAETGSETVRPEEPTPQSESVDYKKLVDKWNEYLEYRDPKGETPEVTMEEIFNANPMAVTDYGFGFKVVTSYSDEIIDLDSEVPDDEITVRTYTYDIYSLVSGKKIKGGLTAKGARGFYEWEFSYEAADHSSYYEFMAIGCIFELAKYEWVEIPNDDPEAEPMGEYVVKYYYFDNEGNALNKEALTERQYVNSNYYGSMTGTFSVLDKGYYVYNGKIIETFKAGQEIVIPVVKNEYKGYKYDLNDHYDGTIRVYNANNVKVAEYVYATTSWIVDRIEILANGNVLIAYSSDVIDDVSDYTYEDGNLKYEIIDIATGKVVQVAAEYVIDRMSTDYDDGGLGLFPKGDYQYAEIYKIADGEADSEISYVILDNELKVIAELPKILKNQVDVYGTISASKIAVEIETGWLYSVDMNTGKCELYVNLEYFTELEGGGFIYRDALYNDAMEKVMDLDDYTVHWFGGDLYLCDSFAGGEYVLTYFKDGQLCQVGFENVPSKVTYGDFTVLRMYRDSEDDRTICEWFSLEGDPLLSGTFYVSELYYNTLIASVYNQDGSVTYKTVRNEKGK